MGVELLFNSVELGVPKQLPADSQTVETKCGREDHTRPRGPSESPDGVDPKIRTRKTQPDGHNSGVKIWSLCSVSSILSHANLQQPFRNPCNKVRGEYFSKEVLPASLSCVVSSCVFLLRLSACVFIIESLWYGKWVYNSTIFLQYISYHLFLCRVIIWTSPWP